MRHIHWTSAALALVLSACVADDGDPVDEARARASVATGQRTGVASTIHTGSESLSPEELERGRLDAGWKRVVQLDSVARGDSTGNPETWEQISASTVNEEATHLPLSGDVAGPSVLKTQILLDRALFSPGIIDGRWGKNTEKAVYWLQEREGLPATGEVDQQTFDRLVRLAGQPRQLVRAHQLTAEDVQGPFVEIPEDIYEKAEMDCMCYESLSEKLSEMFHATPELLRQLNPGVDLDALQAGQSLQVPNVREPSTDPGADVARLVVSDGGFYLHALDANGRILYHFPTTLGSDYAPSPTGDYKVTAIAWDPTWHYQPDLLTGVPDDEEDAIIPRGPNNAVGVVWMQLSKPHYGIHGTSAPATIGYTTSHGCVRLTNWDARFLGEQIHEGIPVEFRDVDNSGESSSE